MSRAHLLDANVLRAFLDTAHERHLATLSRVQKLGDPFVFLSSITHGEVEFGLARPNKLHEDTIREIRVALSRFPVMQVDKHAARPYGALRAWLLERYAPRELRGKLRSLSQLVDPVTDLQLGIQENDLWIASQAIATESVLMTWDHMRRLDEAAKGAGQELHLDDTW